MDQKNDVDMQFTNELKESIAKSVSLHTDKDVALKSKKRVGLLDTLPDVLNVPINSLSRYNRNIVESGIKHHKPIIK
jgi:hypothetical protein